MVFISKNITIDKVTNDNIIIRVKCQINSYAKLTKSKNMLRSNFLAKFKLLTKFISKLNFFILQARLLFDKLRQMFIEIIIFYYFDFEYSTYIKSDIFSYAIDGVSYQLTLDNLN